MSIDYRHSFINGELQGSPGRRPSLTVTEGHWGGILAHHVGGAWGVAMGSSKAMSMADSAILI